MSTEFELITYAILAIALFLLFNHFLPLRRAQNAKEKPMAKMDLNSRII